jgi:hypothetical protein
MLEYREAVLTRLQFQNSFHNLFVGGGREGDCVIKISYLDRL